MTNLQITEEDKNKTGSGQDKSVPATIIECPPMKIASIRLYKQEGRNLKLAKQLNFKSEKELVRTLKLNQKKTTTKEQLEKINSEEYDEVRVQVYTMPKLTGKKKTPELFELALGGSVQEKIDFVKENHDKQITIDQIFEEGSLVDTHSVTKGKGFQGPIQRYGIGKYSIKSEKGNRTPGSMGGWIAHAHWMYRIPKAGQDGYHQRVQNNNLILKISDKPEEINPRGGFINYGEVKNQYVLVKGSIPGPKKRLITLTQPMRPGPKPKYSSESIKAISKESQQ